MSYTMTMALPFIVIGIEFLRHKLCGRKKDQSVQIVATFFVIVYNGLVTKCLQTFMCIKLLDGTQMLIAHPDTTCWEGWHIVLVAASVVFLFVYVIGIPGTFMFVLLRYKNQNMLNDEMVMGRLGFLYGRYEPFWYVHPFTVMHTSLSLPLLLHSSRAFRHPTHTGT